jgi:hypothetical protein
VRAQARDAVAKPGVPPGAADPSPARHAVAHAAAAERAPVLDGRDDDAAWRAAAPVTDFRVYDPTEDGAPRLRTEARVAYDARTLYVFVRAFDPRPDSVVALLSRRDVKTPSDQIKVMLDSYHDRRSGYEFAVNPAGVKRDYYTYNDAREDVTWDAVWDVAARVDSLGWTAEFRIPLSQLRFGRGAGAGGASAGGAGGGGGRTFGLMITREVARTNEKVSWPVLRRSRPGIASQFGTLTGLRELAPARRLELVPYAVTKNVSAPHASAGRFTGYGRAQRQSFGGDLKVGVTGGLTLDATVNPDFGQVEADPALLNLTAFEPFFEERRPFFVEGGGVFQFDPNAPQLFYSRRVGRAPQLAGLVTDPGAAVPGNSTILGATKLTGRVGRGSSLGALAALTGREAVAGTVVEPRTAYGVARLAQDFRGGESGAGVMATLVRRDLAGPAADRLRRSALAAGVDGRHRWDGGAYQVTASAVASAVEGSAAAMARTQRSTVHLYQRPDAGLPYDTTRTRLTGLALTASADKLGGVWRGGTSYQRLTPGFEANDVGFLPQADQQTARAYVTAVSLRPRAFWRRAEATLSLTGEYNAAGMPTTRVPELFLFAERRNASRMSVDAWVDNAGAVYCDRCARGGPALRLSPAANLLMNWSGDPRRPVQPSLAAIYTVGDGGRSALWRVRPYVVVRPATNVSWELGTRYQRNRDNTQWYGNVGAAPGSAGADTTHYVFARLDQHLLSFTARLNVTATPTLSLQLYAEPFVTTGGYSAVRELAAPRASDYDARFRPYALAGGAEGFNTKQFRSNAVVRWEYRPGSALFLVWQQGRNQDDRDAGVFAPGRDYQNLFGARPDNTLLLKASYWLGR